MHLVISIFGRNSVKRKFSAQEMFESKEEMVKFKMLHKLNNVTYITYGPGAGWAGDVQN